MVNFHVLKAKRARFKILVGYAFVYVDIYFIYIFGVIMIK